MKNLLLLTIFLIASAISVSAADNIDSLKQKLQLTTNDSLKGPVYSAIAAEYMKYDTITDKRQKLRYQNEALNYTMLALHMYSKYDDTTGLRTSFYNLATIYHSQKKFVQAKWFILQSNNLSRLQNDVPNIISSLIKLSAIKMDIKDYSLAMRDLNEALRLSTKNKMPLLESDVQRYYSFLYNRMKDYKKGDIALKRSIFIKDSIKKDEALKILAVQDSIKNRQDSINKKKVYASNKKSYKLNDAKKIASL
ncbi:hypothetical protein [Mucilaginibacter segetis]|uniref:Tetratricopeptide repeat protein n=1 Tax=Mucilaginibacter segetis TaxID=2793071 RepID=A0A934ULN1_9SPHI|nr:hypothetical protein [Mucilaginibacter segetis]MBK0378758.1 hypothetical protein [Mucilaginibacter segetis]